MGQNMENVDFYTLFTKSSQLWSLMRRNYDFFSSLELLDRFLSVLLDTLSKVVLKSLFYKAFKYSLKVRRRLKLKKTDELLAQNGFFCEHGEMTTSFLRLIDLNR